MQRVMGGNLPAEMWHELMEEAHKDRDPQPLPGTASVARISSGHSSPPVARTTRPEVLPWMAPRETASSTPPMRAPVSAPPAPSPSRGIAAAPRTAQSPSVVRIAPAAPANVGQRIVVAPPAATSAAPRAAARRLPASAGANAVAAARKHPSDRISEDFLARVLEKPAGAPAEKSPVLAERRHRFDADEIRRSIDAAPAATAEADQQPVRLPSGPAPRGMMSLGAGLGGGD